MPVAFDAATSSNSSAASYNWTHTPSGTPSTAVVGVHVRENSTSVSTVTYGGTGMTRVALAINSTLNRWEIFRLDSPASGNQSVAVTLGGAQESCAIACTLTGAGAGNPIAVNSQIGLDTAAACANAVLSEANSLVLGFIGVERSNTDAEIAPGASQTQRQSVSGPTLDRPRAELTTQAGAAGAVNNRWTLTNADNNLIVSMTFSENNGGFAASLTGIQGAVDNPWSG